MISGNDHHDDPDKGERGDVRDAGRPGRRNIFDDIVRLAGSGKRIDPGAEGTNPLRQIRNELRLENDITRLKLELDERVDRLVGSRMLKERDREIAGLRKKIGELNEMENLSFLLHKVNVKAREKLLSSPAFRSEFDGGGERDIVVMSMDIRRSTDLMLKARSPRDYAEFISTLSEKLTGIIIDNYGIYDKFTGDGILSFFPDFYSGEDAMGYALKAAMECHDCFNRHYAASRNMFSSVFRDMGLGIGIDYGRANIIRINREITVVGEPVVYACRFAGAKAGDTLLNQNAREVAVKMYGRRVKLIETDIDIKHEGRFIAWRVGDVAKLKLRAPGWPGERG